MSILHLLKVKKSNLIYSGIYKITNIITNKIYIGSAVNFYKRFYLHLNMLNNNKHHSKYLQKSWIKYGKENFKFEILATCPKEYLIKLEQWFIDNLKPEYNTCKIAGSLLGFKKSEESKLKQSIAIKGKKQSLEHILNRSISLKGRKCSELAKQINGDRYRGVKRSKEYIDNWNLKKYKKVYQYDLNNNFIKEWNSIKKASEFYKTTTISQCCKHKLKTCKGFKWEYNKL